MEAAVQNDRSSNCTPCPRTGQTIVLLVLGHARFMLCFTHQITHAAPLGVCRQVSNGGSQGITRSFSQNMDFLLKDLHLEHTED